MLGGGGRCRDPSRRLRRQLPAGRGVTSRPASLLQNERQSTQRHETSRNLHTRHEAAHRHIGDGQGEGAGITGTQTQHATHNSAQILTSHAERRDKVQIGPARRGAIRGPRCAREIDGHLALAVGARGIKDEANLRKWQHIGFNWVQGLTR